MQTGKVKRAMAKGTKGSHSDEPVTIEERIRHYKSVVVAYTNVLETYDRQKEEIQTERDKLHARERLLESTYKEAPAFIDSANLALREAQRILEERKVRGQGGQSKSKIQRMIDKRDRLLRTLAKAQADLDTLTGEGDDS